MYGIGVNIPGPFDLYINDIAARKENEPGMHNAAIERDEKDGVIRCKYDGLYAKVSAKIEKNTEIKKVKEKINKKNFFINF
jgi:hypothetical protein